MYQNGQGTLDELQEVLDEAHRYDHYLVARCPFHDDSRPSFFVYPDTYRCLSCGAHGRTDKLLQRIEPSHVLTRKENFHNPFTHWLRDHDLAFILRTACQYQPSHYLLGRGISAEIQVRLDIGKLDDWITFPIYNQKGYLIGAVARAGEGNHSRAKYIIPARQDPSLLYVPSWKRIENRENVLVTFGILDAVTLYILGYASVSTTTGKTISSEGFIGIRKNLIIIPDMGEEQEAHQLASKLGWRGHVARLDYPEGTKDINDILQVYRDSNRVRELVEASYGDNLGRCKRNRDRFDLTETFVSGDSQT